MHLHNLNASQEDFDRCKRIINEKMIVANLELSDLELELLTEDILITAGTLEWSFEDVSIKQICDQYIQSNFYPRFKRLHSDKLGPTFKY